MLICRFCVVENAKLFASLIARKAKDIDALINSLPSADCSRDIQVSLRVSNVVERQLLSLCACTGRQKAYDYLRSKTRQCQQSLKQL